MTTAAEGRNQWVDKWTMKQVRAGETADQREESKSSTNISRSACTHSVANTTSVSSHMLLSLSARVMFPTLSSTADTMPLHTFCGRKLWL